MSLSERSLNVPGVNTFPKDFFWGSATASYQVEGGIDNNDWAHESSKGNVPVCGEATDHYSRFENDFDLAQSLKHNAHRFSIEWSRIEPEEGRFDEREIEHYREVIRALKRRGIEPFVTLWHFTLPIWFVEKGGFLNPQAPEIFARYCAFVVKNLGGEVRFWMTINEPLVWASGSYLKGKWPPFKKSIFIFLKIIRALIVSHKRAYKEIKLTEPQAQVGVAKHNIYFDSNWNPWNQVCRSLSSWFWNRLFLNRTKKYQDFIGLNYYFYKKFGGNPNLAKSDMGWDIFPQGLHACLVELGRYGKPLYVTENGVADRQDLVRADFIRNSLASVLQAINDGAPVKGYFYWSLLDNYEWSYGFKERFGLIEVDYDTLERKIRNSAFVYKDIIEKNSL